MKEYLLLLRGGDTRMAELSDEDRTAHIDKFKAYMGDLAQKDVLVGGLPLSSDGRILTNQGVVSDVVRSSEGQAVGGWLQIRASDYEGAIKMTRACPIFEHNGNVEIREIMSMDM